MTGLSPTPEDKVQSLSKILWQFLKELNKHLLYDPAIAFIGVYLGEKKAISLQTLVPDCS